MERGNLVSTGPVFASLLLADEINRASPRTQSALLQAMQERASQLQAKIMNCRNPSLFWQRKTRLNKRELPTPRSAAGSFSIIDRGWLPRYRHGTRDYFRDHGADNGQASAVFDADG